MMTQQAIESTIKEIRAKAEDTFFSVHFIKKNGDLRKMVARLGVQKGVKGVGLAFDPTAKRLLCVYDVQKQGFRMIRIDTIQHLQIKGDKLV